jgi:hypothetical protein
MASPSLYSDRITQILGNALGFNSPNTQRRGDRGFDVNEFKSALGERGIVPTNLFIVTIGANPTNAMGLHGITPRNLTFFCHKTDLPGIDLAISENRPVGIGPLERYPHAAIFGDIELQFIADGNGSILSFFHEWINGIIPYKNDKVTSNFFKMAYKDEYKCNINISVYNHSSDKILEYTLYECFPYRLNQTLMEWSPSNNFMNIGVSFYYKSFDTNRLTANSGSTIGLTAIQQIIKAGTIAQTISTINKPQSIADIINLVNNANIIASTSGFFSR